MHICKWNEEYLHVSDEKNNIIKADSQNKIINLMETLQEALNQRHSVITKNLDPIERQSQNHGNHVQAEVSSKRVTYSQRAVGNAK
jgi:hypothetical protein